MKTGHSVCITIHFMHEPHFSMQLKRDASASHSNESQEKINLSRKKLGLSFEKDKVEFHKQNPSSQEEHRRVEDYLKTKILEMQLHTLPGGGKNGV